MEKLLQQFHFTKPEIHVYKTLLKLGGATVSYIAEATRLKRTTCQEYVRSLEEKGFINSSKIGNRFFYQAEDPDRFVQMVHERMVVVDRLLHDLKTKKRKERWGVRTLSTREGESVIKRARRQKIDVIEMNHDDASLSLVGERTILLKGRGEDIEAIEMTSSSLVTFHQQLLRA